MNFDEVLKITDGVVFDSTGKHLSDAQRAVLLGTWQRQKYHEIALTYRCTPEYLKQDVGPKLWQLLSVELGEKVSKTNFRSVLERRRATLLEDQPFIENGYIPLQNTSQETLVEFESIPLPPVQIDWGEASDASSFCGRESELQQLKQWILNEHCRVVALLGMGGIGKTSISVELAQQIQSEFQFVIWRSLRNAPPLEEILADIIQFISPEPDLELPEDDYKQISLLIELIRVFRCLIILDNGESILQEGDRAGQYPEGYQNYGEFFKRLGETRHQSCLILTSREKPREIAALEGKSLNIHSLLMQGLATEKCREVIQSKGLLGTEEQWNQLIYRYGGNPLAIKIVTTTIEDLFAGKVHEFLEQIQQGSAIFGDIRDLLEQQLERLSALETEIMYWLAINRESVSLTELKSDLLGFVSPNELIESLESLRRRSLIEKSYDGFTQQPVVMEYIIEQFIDNISREIKTENINYLHQYAVLKSQAKDYIRESQVRLILSPILRQITIQYRLRGELQEKFKSLLANLKSQPEPYPSYAGGNIINLCHYLDLDLVNYDFSRLTIWQAYLQDANLQGVNFSEANLSRSVFAKTLGNSLTVALGINHQLATGDTEGKILLWNVEDGQQRLIFQGKTGSIKTMSFSPDGQLVASGGEDKIVRIWQVNTGECLQRCFDHQDTINYVNFSPDGTLLVSGSDDQTIRLWQVKTGKCLSIFNGHTEAVKRVCFSPDGNTIASSSEDQSIKLWQTETGECLQTFWGDFSLNWTVTFATTAKVKQQAIASSCDENTVKLWNVETGQCVHTLTGHQDSVWTVAFSPQGELLASSSDDQTVKLWNVHEGEILKTLRGFKSQVCSLAFSPDQPILATGSQEQLVQLWDINSGQRLRTLRGHKHQVWSFAISPDRAMLVTGSDDHLVRLWDIHTGRCIRRFSGHTDWVWSVAFHPSGQLVASGSYDQTVKVWNLQTGDCVKTFHGHNDRVQAVAFSPQGNILVSCGSDQTLRLWDIQTGECLHCLTGHSRSIGSVAFCPQGRLLASGSYDQTIKLWDMETGNCLQTLAGHTQRVHELCFSADGEYLASGSYDHHVRLWEVKTGNCLKVWRGNFDRIQGIQFNPQGQLWVSGSMDENLRLWDLERQTCVKVLSNCQSSTWSVIFSHDSQILVSGSHDQALRVWNLATEECIQIFHTDQPYHGMNITGVTGITTAQKAALKALGAIDLESRDYDMSYEL
ncbi:MAG: NB-ARC domain-containing protein [Microcoleaceae cyanobacterium]